MWVGCTGRSACATGKKEERGKAEAALARCRLYTRAMMAKSENTKKLFLVDAMAHIYRAFYAPMVRMNAPSGIPTKVPFLFANIVRRLLKDYKPEYVAIVFDTRQADVPRQII